ncbi:hypothetical protein [Aquimarina sp. 2201CG14-23]|uniref:hypothetical protein n=1 Tax=Aquimarina mycalae TaxID=3040073 RepID=UPI002477E542|nr:hypothetical protein [Aquimarina sp. 2201CG14-23]MDH7446138.1 hypothetical protein [Aquimarina sp. 2201CG14-23]
MLNTYFKDLTPTNKQFAIHRIASRNDATEEIVKKVLEHFNPLMDIQKNRVVVHRNAYNKLVKDIRREKVPLL